ncbi:hypothetical protein FQR65_LT09452 [Abscondita terminalis]|nr:hypothetical protein FQR65_LT09452 [Abscondita terminalis]
MDNLKRNLVCCGRSSYEWAQFYTIFIASLGGFTTMAFTSWPSPTTPILTSNGTITFEEASYFSVIPPLVSTIASPLVGTLFNVISRKTMFILMIVPQILSWGVLILWNNLLHLYISRILIGISDGIIYCLLPTYIGEITTPTQRGAWGSLFMILGYLGQFSINAIGSYCSIKTTAFIFLSVPVVQLIFVFGLPESPYYFLINQKNSKAEKSLKLLRRNKNVEEELDSIKTNVKQQMLKPGTWINLFAIPVNRRILFISIMIRFFQSFSGISTFSIYTQKMFAISGGTLSSSLSSIIYTGVLFLSGCIYAFIIHKQGRRPLMLFSTTCATITLFIKAAYLYLHFETSLDMSSFRWIPLTTMVFYICTSIGGIGILPSVLMGELFSSNIKGKAVTIANVFYFLFLIVVPKLFQFLITHYSLYLPFLMFAFCTLLGTAFFYKFLPETKGKTLEEIQQNLSISAGTKTNPSLYIPSFLWSLGCDNVLLSSCLHGGNINTESSSRLEQPSYDIIYLGQLLINIIGSYCTIKTTALIFLSVPVIQFLCILFIPESPYYLLIKHKTLKAEKSLKRLRLKRNIEEELNCLSNDVERQISEPGSWKHLFLISTNRRALLICIVMRLFQQFSGIAAFSVYTQTIFSLAGKRLSASVSAIIYSSVVLVVSCIYLFVVDKLGRRNLMLISSIGASIALFTVAAYFYVEFETDLEVSNYGWIPLAALIMYTCTSTGGVAVLPMLMTGEIFSSSIKGIATGAANMFCFVFIIASLKLFDYLLLQFGMYVMGDLLVKAIWFKFTIVSYIRLTKVLLTMTVKGLEYFFQFGTKNYEWPQILTIFIVSLCGITSMAFLSWPSPAIPILMSNSTTMDSITYEEASYLAVIPPVVTILVSPLISVLVDVIGRKKLIILVTVLHIISWSIMAIAKTLLHMYISRVVYGISDAIIFCSIPPYIGEISTPRIRGNWGNMFMVNVFLGQFLMNAIGSYCSITTTAIIFMTIPLIQFLFIWHFPESPYFLLMKRKNSETEKSLKWFRWNRDVRDELQSLTADVERQISEPGSWRHLFLISTNRKAIFICVTMRIFQQFSGIPAFAVYTQQLFAIAGGKLSSSASSLIYTGGLFLVAITYFLVLRKIGRRPLMLFSAICAALALLSESCYFYLQSETDVNLSDVSWIPLAIMGFYMLTSVGGFGLLPNLMLGELFSSSIKGKAMAVANIACFLCVLAVPKLFHYLSAEFASMSGITSMALMAWPSPSTPILTSNSSHIDIITHEEASYFAVIPAVFAVIGSPLIGILMDTIGRKKLIVFFAIPHIISWGIIYLANNLTHLYISRAIYGMFDGIVFSTIPTYIAEISSPNVRARWGNLLLSLMFLGQFLVNVIVELLLALLIPESPYFLIMKGQNLEAEKSLQLLRWNKNVEKEFDNIKEAIQRQLLQPGSFKDLLVISNNRKPLLICIVMRTFQQFSGVNAFTVYCQQLFASAGGKLSSSISAIIYTGVLLVISFLLLFVVHKFGRRPWLFFSTTCAAVALFIEAVYFYLQFEVELDMSAVTWIPLAAMIFYIVAGSAGVTILPTLIIAELFSSSVKGKAVGIVTVIFYLCFLVVPKLFQYLSSEFSMYIPFLLFSVCTLASTVFYYLFLPETRGKTLEEVQDILTNRKVIHL